VHPGLAVVRRCHLLVGAREPSALPLYKAARFARLRRKAILRRPTLQFRFLATRREQVKDPRWHRTTLMLRQSMLHGTALNVLQCQDSD
jgi:hypothetical protein